MILNTCIVYDIQNQWITQSAGVIWLTLWILVIICGSAMKAVCNVVENNGCCIIWLLLLNILQVDVVIPLWMIIVHTFPDLMTIFDWNDSDEEQEKEPEKDRKYIKHFDACQAYGWSSRVLQFLLSPTFHLASHLWR